MEMKASILVVDDEERIRRLLRMYLEKEGYIIEEAEDGRTPCAWRLKQTMT